MNGNGGPPNANGRAVTAWSSLLSRLQGHPREAHPDLVAYRRLALQLHHDLPRPEGQRVALLAPPYPSSLCGSGSSTLACCLADELSGPVLLVDASPPGASAIPLAGAADARGFFDLLARPDLGLGALVRPTTHPSVQFLPAGASDAGSPWAPDAVRAFLDAAAGRFEFVLLAGGSVLGEATALRLAPFVGCVLLLAIENETHVADLDAAQEALSRCRARKVGIVLTTPLG